MSSVSRPAALVAAICSICSILAAAPARPDLEEILLAVRLDQGAPGELLLVLEGPDGAFVGLGALAETLELAIDVDAEQGTASGFVITPERELWLDRDAGSARVDGRVVALRAGDVLTRDDDLYVAVDRLPDLLPLVVEIDARAAVLVVHSREQFPAALRLERERQGRRAGGVDPELAGERLDLPRRLIGAPTVDLTATWQGTEDTSALSHAILMTGDLLGLDAMVAASGSDDDFGEVRWSLGRRDPLGRALGPLGLTEAVIGEIAFPGLDLVSGTSSGRGLLLDNRPLDRPTSFDRHTFRGELPPGWDVELYRDGDLIAWFGDSGLGFYEFLDVDLLWGPNRFRLLFHGPRGERREENVVFDVSEAQVPVGRAEWRVAALDDPRGAATERALAEVDYGISRRLSLGAAVAQVAGEDEDLRYATVRGHGAFGRLLLGVDLARSLDREADAARVTLRTSVGPVRLSLDHSMLDDSFDADPLIARWGAASQRTLARVDGAFRVGQRSGISLGLAMRRDVLVAGGEVDELDARVGWSRSGLFVSNRVSWVEQRGNGDGSSSAQGVLLASRYGRWLSVRGELAYAIRPQLELQTATVTLERRLRPGLLASLEGRRGLGDSADTEVLAELRRYRGSIGYGLGVGWSEQSGARVRGSLAVGLARDPLSQRWHTDAEPLAGSGSLALRAFVDLDGDGAWSSGDLPLEGVGFILDRVVPRVRTGPDGIAFVPRVPAWREVAVAIATRTLEDPQHVPADAAVRLVPRPGVVAPVDLPVVATGEVTGTVRLREGGVSNPRGGVRLQLLDAAGAVVAEERSAYDGFFELSRVPPGSYRLVVPRSELLRLEAAGVRGHLVEISNQGAILDGLDLLVERGRSAPVEPIQTALGGPVSSIRPAVEQASVPKRPASAPSPAPIRHDAGRRTGPEPFAVRGWSGPSPAWVVQVAAFRTEGAAKRYAVRIGPRLEVPVTVAVADLGERGVWRRVLAGAASGPAAAEALAMRVARLLEVETPRVLEVVAAPLGAAAAPSLPLADPREDELVSPIQPVTQSVAPISADTETPNEAGPWSLQVASFADADAAVVEARRLSREWDRPAAVAVAALATGVIRHRVYLTGFSGRGEAEELIERLGAAGVQALGPLRLPEGASRVPGP